MERLIWGAQFFTVTSTQDGAYPFRVRAYDKVGHVSNWVTATITVDTSGPQITNPAPPNNAVISATTPAISGRFSSTSAINTGSFSLIVDGQSRSAQVTTTGFTLTLTTALTEGLHHVVASVANTANSGSRIWDFTVDSVAPSVTNLTASQNGGRDIALSWSGSDPAPGSGELRYEVRYWDALTPTNVINWLSGVTYTSTTFSSGTLGHSYHFQVRASDPAGNVSGWVQAGPVLLSRVTKYYLFGGSRVAMRQGNVVYYLHGDHLGSTSLTTDANGQKISESRYLPYGQIRFGTTGPTDFGFTSQRLEAGFGLMDYNARYYSPGLGRFISADTVVPEPLNSQEWNRYSYVTNNPLRYKDPTGHKQESGAGIGGGREVYLILAHQYEEAAAAAGNSWRGTLNEYNSAMAGKYYSLAEGNVVNAQVQDAHLQGSLYTRLATSGYFGQDAQINAAVDAASDDIAQGGLNSLGGALGPGVVGVAGAAGYTARKSAAELLPTFKGSPHKWIRNQLTENGFILQKKSAVGNETWTHSDGSVVRIDPYGNVKTAPWKTANNAHIHKYAPGEIGLNDYGVPSTNPNETHIGIPNPQDLPIVRNRPHGTGTQ